VKTNQPIADDRVRNRTLYWCTPSVYLALLINIIVVLILYYVLRKKVRLDLPLSREGQSLVTKNKLIAWVVFAVGLVALFWGFATVSESSSGLFAIFGGITALLGALVFGSRKAVLLRVTKIKGDNAWLAGAHKDFVASLPRYP
jgi:hypothetical protein